MWELREGAGPWPLEGLTPREGVDPTGEHCAGKQPEEPTGSQSKGLTHRVVCLPALYRYSLRRQGKEPPGNAEGHFSSRQLPGVGRGFPCWLWSPLGHCGARGFCLHLHPAGQWGGWIPDSQREPGPVAALTQVRVQGDLEPNRRALTSGH